MVIYFPERAHLFPGKVLDTATKLVARFSGIIVVYFRLPFFCFVIVAKATLRPLF